MKEVRPEINNKIVENRAYEIVTFKTGYLSAEPIQYVSRSGDEATSEQISLLNEMMFSEHKSTQDKELLEWNHICGTAYRFVVPDPRDEEDEAPFEMHVLDPRNTFIIYSNKIGGKPLAGCTYWIDDNNVNHLSVYTDNVYYELEDFVLSKPAEPHALGKVPIIEYPLNNARIGAFEVGLPLLDQLNNIASNRMDGLEQEIQAFIKFINCEISLEEYELFRKNGAIKVKSVDGLQADVDVVKTPLNQTESHIMANDVYDSILTICGMPNRNGGSSTSDTGKAVEMRDGWSTAELRAKESEEMFKKSEQEMLKIVINIAGMKGKLKLKLKDVGMQFTRRNYENIQSKSQVLVTMLGNDKIHPLLAFSHSGLFTDPEKAYSMSMEHYETISREAEQKRTSEQNTQNRETVEGTTNKNAGEKE